ncbi:MAG: hypothetical protein ACRDSR_13315 [Pseudonocardiaceae bacterium]
MTASRAILYCTVNGVCNNTNGLGRQTKTLLSALARHRAKLLCCVGPFDVHVACPQPGPDTWAFNPADLAFSRRVVTSWGGLVHALPYDRRAEFWSVPTWQASVDMIRCSRAGEDLLIAGHRGLVAG